MVDSSARLLRLLSLFQARRYWSGAELSERLDVTPRTLRRDVDRLRSLGYPVNSSTGVAGGYQLGAGATLPPLQLDDDEAVAVAVGLRTAASGSVTGIEEASVRAMAKLQQVLPEALRRRVADLHSFIVPLTGTGPTVDAEKLSTIATSCRDHSVLEFEYLSREGKSSTRAVEPHRLVHTGRRWYLAAWDPGREDWRTFRVDRMGSDLTMGRRFTPRPPPEGDFAVFVSRSVGFAPYPHRAEVILRASREAAMERVPPSVGMVEAIDEQTCVLRTGGGSLEGLSAYLAMIGFEFEVRTPPELIEVVRRLARRFADAIPSAEPPSDPPASPALPESTPPEA